jgi:hypothetical protein
MTSPIRNTDPSASDKSNPGETILTLSTARNMVPLVQRILQDVLQCRQELARMQPEQSWLDSQRRTLAWPDRLRRYQLKEAIAAQEEYLSQVLGELESLGVTLLDQVKGQVGFPTLVNGRRAFFSWRLGEESLKHWHFAGEKTRRVIPPSWGLEAEVP